MLSLFVYYRRRDVGALAGSYLNTAKHLKRSHHAITMRSFKSREPSSLCAATLKSRDCFGVIFGHLERHGREVIFPVLVLSIQRVCFRWPIT